MVNIKYHIGSGERALFWKDRWVGGRPLVAQFPDLFNCVAEKDVRPKAYLTIAGGQVVWCPNFRRNLKDHELPISYRSLSS